jgi:hypothetical protein
MRLIVLRGIPGSGKSTFAKTNLPEADLIASADDGMMVDGVYKFDPAKLPAAHGACLLAVIAALQEGAAQNEMARISGISLSEMVIVVDNTSTSVAEVAPYVAVGQAYGAEVVIMTLRIDPKIAGPRNVHGVPQAGVDRMAAALDKGSEGMMPWWDHEVLTWDPETSEYRTF